MQLIPDRFRRKAVVLSPAVQASITDGTANFQVPLSISQASRAAYFQTASASYGFLYERHPSVTTVVDFLSRNMSELHMCLFERDGEGRQENNVHPAAQVIAHPNDWQTPEQFMFGVVADYLIYGTSFTLKVRAGNDVALMRVPAHAVGVRGDLFRPTGYELFRMDNDPLPIAVGDMIAIGGYNPMHGRFGISKLETLRLTLIEEAVGQATMTEWMKNGMQGGWIKRPLEAPEWTVKDRERFEEGWQARQANANRGKSPVLEDGMEFVAAAVSPRESAALEHRLATKAEVARIYGVPLTLVGLEGSDPVAERDQLYRDVLPPLAKLIAGSFTLQLAEQEYGATDMFFAFNMDDKLEGAEDKLQKLVGAAGAPILTRNESRERAGYPRMDDPEADKLMLPAGVGDAPVKPATNVMPIPDPNTPAQDGSARQGAPPAAKEDDQVRTKALLLAQHAELEGRRDAYAQEYADLLNNHYDRQLRILKSRQKAALDVNRADSELAADLLRQHQRTVQAEGTIAAAQMAHVGFDMNQVAHYLEAGAAATAANVNASVQDAIATGTEPDQAFTDAKDTAILLGMSLASHLVSFSQVEAAKQTPDSAHRQKMWLSSHRPNSRHGNLDGESVMLNHKFSNGTRWPGDVNGDPHDTANCHCLLQIR